MKNIIKFVMLAASMTVATSAVANDLDDLLKQVKNDRISEGKLDKKREAEFKSARADKQSLLNKAKKELANQNARNLRLTKEYAANDITIAQRAVELDNATGTLGEMFGVTRAAAADAYGQIATSIVSSEFAGRGKALDVIANSKKIPELEQLEELWIALQTEMTQSGNRPYAHTGNLP